jgi:uncharacterized protein (TIGR02145 family)
MNKETLLKSFERSLKENNQELIEKISKILEPKYTPQFGAIDILGRSHKTAVIGTQEWMAENLLCPELGCHFNNDPKNSKGGYGTLHTHYAIPSINEVLPAGWRVPTDEEWEKLIDFVGENAGTKLKSKEGWENGGNGTDDYGFNAVPAGYRYYTGTQFYYRGANAIYWSSSVGSSSLAWYRQFYNNSAQVYRTNNSRSRGLSVRCVRDLK